MWKWKPNPKISAGLCCLYIYENAECEDIEILDTEAIKCQINAAFPGWFDADSEYYFHCNVLPTGITLYSNSSTPKTSQNRVFDVKMCRFAKSFACFNNVRRVITIGKINVTGQAPHRW
jgi:hypothetical protein